MSVPATAQPDPYVGLVLDGEFRIEQKLGAGGMGAVYLARQAFTERAVAIKVVHHHLTDEELVRRFQQEAKIASRLSHPNIVTIFKFGQHDGTLYIAMECVEGRTLDKIVHGSQGMDPERALPLMREMAEALAYAHEQKIIHRDIKLENMMVARTGRRETIKILDFGIAKMLDNTQVVTKTGMICGSPMYMSPEQWLQLPDVDGRTDIYSLGCVYYAMVTGKQPFYADSTLGYMMAHLQSLPRPPIELTSWLSPLPELNDIIVRCLQRDRADRYPDAYSLAEALREAQLKLQSRRRPGTSEAPAEPAVPDAALGTLPVVPSKPGISRPPEPALPGASASSAAVDPAASRADIDSAALVTPASPVSAPASPVSAAVSAFGQALVAAPQGGGSTGTWPEVNGILSSALGGASAREPAPVAAPAPGDGAGSDAALPADEPVHAPVAPPGSELSWKVAVGASAFDDEERQRARRIHLLVVAAGGVLWLSLAVSLLLLR